MSDITFKHVPVTFQMAPYGLKHFYEIGGGGGGGLSKCSKTL